MRASQTTGKRNHQHQVAVTAVAKACALTNATTVTPSATADVPIMPYKTVLSGSPFMLKTPATNPNGRKTTVTFSTHLKARQTRA
ncbi:uncharacterized protein BKCO1_5900057 [Diplodia corticola]|uniref:Uncharacterized protein n=1 Tax=Diplodia corticola TaxID=236234 RepID=A0A1J9RRI2_9PEZI|nr:uncharacterized protein BKCO1_5900057 [Diplodia corticola]OJD30508.1 hypothetical protein BKCO1_5900057 [Diplodia corticola]